jgi:alpha-galactosidase
MPVLNSRPTSSPQGLALGALTQIGALNDGLSKAPALGWNTWNKFGCGINETLVRDVADAMISQGLAAKGYNYINLDDCWMSKQRDGAGRLVADPIRFPSGIKALADYLHGRGLKLGIYSSAGTVTCEKYPASLYYEGVDAQTFADWGVDYLKYDNCAAEKFDVKTRYARMRNALEATGRPILFSLCEWGMDNVAAWGAEMGHSWRTVADIRPNWGSIMEEVDVNQRRWRHAGPGRGFNDPDMLEVGNGEMTEAENRAHFSLWAVMKSPLIIGCDVRAVDESTMSVLSNEEVIAVNQDPLGVQARRTWSDNTGSSATEAIVALCGGHMGWDHNTDGTISRKDAKTGKKMCLTVKGGNFTLGAAVTVEECGAGISQNWRYDGQLIAPAQTAAGPVWHAEINWCKLGGPFGTEYCNPTWAVRVLVIVAAVVAALGCLVAAFQCSRSRPQLLACFLTVTSALGSLLIWVGFGIWTTVEAGLCRAESGSCDAAGWSWSSSALVPASGALLLVASALALAALFKLRRTQDLPLFKKPEEKDENKDEDLAETVRGVTDGPLLDKDAQSLKKHRGLVASLALACLGTLLLVIAIATPTWLVVESPLPTAAPLPSTSVGLWGWTGRGLCLEVVEGPDLVEWGIGLRLGACNRFRAQQRWTRHPAEFGSSFTNAWQGLCMSPDTDAPRGNATEVWAGPLADGARVALLLNRGDVPATITASWDVLGLAPTGDHQVRDLWALETTVVDTRADGGITVADIPAHGAVLYRITPPAEELAVKLNPGV